MTETTETPRLGGAVAAMLAEAEDTASQIARLRRSLDEAELKRRKLVTALDAAAGALPVPERERIARRLAGLAEAMTPKRGRLPDARQQAVVEYLGERAQDAETQVVRVAEVQARLEQIGYRDIPHGYASNAMARLAAQGFAVKLGYARYRINGIHPELVAIRFRLLDAAVARIDARDRELAEAERRGRDRKWRG